MTKTQIANIALAKFREGRITNIESTTDPVAVVMNDQYDHALELLLEEHRWNFAGKRVTLTKISDDPPFGWDHQYALPADCIRLKDVNGENVEASSKSFTLEGRYLLTNDDTVTITYVAKIIDTNFFSPSFSEALAFKLSSLTCGRLTGDTELAIMLDKQYNYALSKAIHNDTKADGSREHNLMQRMLNSSAILGGSSLTGTGYTRTVSSTSGTVAAHKHELTDLLGTGATDGQTIIWNDADQIWEAGDAASVSTDAIFDAAGDLVVGTGADTAAKLPIGANGLVLKSNGTTAVWDAIAGTGDVVGDTSSVDNAITRFDGTTGKAIQNSGASIDDTGNLTANNFTGTSSGANTGDQDLSTYQLKPSEGAFIDGDKTKLDGIATGAELNDPTTLVDADIGVNVQAHSAVLDATTASFLTTDETKLDGIEASADVTDTINVTAAGALMDSEVTNLAQVKAFDTTDYAAASHTHVASTDIVATGTPSATTYLRGDDTWATVASGGDVATDAIFTTAGDLVVGTGSSTSARLGIGSNGQVLKVTGGTVGWGTGSGGSVSQLSDLSDVNTSTPTSGFALIADGVDFESRAITAADVSDFDTEVGNNTDVAANTAASHAAATKSGTGTYVTLSAQDIVVDPIDPSDLSATGTPSASTFLRGDNTWAVPEGTGGGGETAETSIWIDAGALLPDANAEASSKTGTNGNVDVMLMANTEKVYAKWTPPPQWDGGTISVDLYWTATGATAGHKVKWNVAAQAGGNDDAWDTVFPTPTATADDDVIASGDIHIIPASAITVGGTPADGDCVFFEIERTASGATQMSQEAELLGVRVNYENSLIQNWYVTKMGTEADDASGTGEKTAWVAPAAGKIHAVHSGCSTATAGGALTVDVQKGGTTILSTMGIIDSTETSTSTGTAHVLTTSPTSFAAGDRISFLINTFGGTGAKGLHTDLLISWD